MIFVKLCCERMVGHITVRKIKRKAISLKKEAIRLNEVLQKNSSWQKKLQKVAFVCGVLLCALFLPLLTVNLTFLFKSAVSPEKMPGINGVVPLVVNSGSMETAINRGDMIFIKNNESDYREDDIVSYYNDKSELITHRIIQIHETNGKILYSTKGDNNNVKDRALISPDQIVGTYFFRIPKIGFLSMFLGKPSVLIILLMAPAALFIISLLQRQAKAGREQTLLVEGLKNELEKAKRDLSVEKQKGKGKSISKRKKRKRR